MSVLETRVIQWDDTRYWSKGKCLYTGMEVVSLLPFFLDVLEWCTFEMECMMVDVSEPPK